MRLSPIGTRSPLRTLTLPARGGERRYKELPPPRLATIPAVTSVRCTPRLLISSTSAVRVPPTPVPSELMAVVQTPFAMTLGQQPPKMYAALAQPKRALAPAPALELRCKRKIQFVPYAGQPPQPASVARRNARERNRVKQVNNGFATLRQHIPPSVAQAFAPPGPAAARTAAKKLSKVETLRLAVEYIRSLKQMIDEHEEPAGGQENRYYGAQDQYQYVLPTPTCSEASQSPTPSQSSDGSFSAGYTQHVYRQEAYEPYEPKSPADEELLDAIFSWQQE